MELTELEAAGLTAALYGPPADRVWLYVHGKGGYKEEAADFAALACPRGWQVLAADLPEHGARRGDWVPLDPWHAAPELRALLGYAKERWQHTALRCTSLGAWFSLLAFAGERLEQALFVSPVVDMEGLIRDMMGWAGVSKPNWRRPASWTLPSGRPSPGPTSSMSAPIRCAAGPLPPPCCTPPGTPCSAGRR